MNVIVLGGCGIQGRAALYDLMKNPNVDQLACADMQPELTRSFSFLDLDRIQLVPLDASDPDKLISILSKGYDIVIDFLPPEYIRIVTESAINAGIHLIHTNYADPILDLDVAARQSGITVMPECGLDPGIDLVLYRYGWMHFDSLYRIDSYCGGIPEKAACDNPLNYKISWNFSGVLRSLNRDATVIKNHQICHIPGDAQHDNQFIHHIEFPEIGVLEAIPNGNAHRFCQLLNIDDTISETGRYTLRWPGWCDFWRPLKRLGFLSDTPVAGLPGAISPSQFMANFLAPQLQYGPDEKDLALMLNVFEGIKDGKRKRLTTTLRIERDLSTGLMAMSMGVAYPACIVAEMVVTGKISQKGILSPVNDIPPELFIEELKKRGIEADMEMVVVE